MIMLANAKAKAKKPAKTTSAQGFGAKKSEPFPPPVQDLIKACKALARDAAEQDSAAADTQRWFQLAAAAAQLEEYAEARVLLEAGIEHCGAENAEMLVRALGQMRRTGPSPALEAEGVALAWPGKGDESKYAAGETRFERLSAPAWPNDCPRGTYYPTGHAAIAVSTTPVLPPDECAWVVSQAERVAKLFLAHAQKGAAQPHAGADMHVNGTRPMLALDPLRDVITGHRHASDLRCPSTRDGYAHGPGCAAPEVTASHGDQVCYATASRKGLSCQLT
jgi:hypothetical protein